MSGKVHVRRHLRTINRGKMGQIKGWKKKGRCFVKKDFGEVCIWKGEVDRVDRGLYREHSKKGYSVTIDTESNNFDKWFKLKSSAISFAKKYMKLHPRG